MAAYLQGLICPQKTTPFGASQEQDQLVSSCTYISNMAPRPTPGMPTVLTYTQRTHLLHVSCTKQCKLMLHHVRKAQGKDTDGVDDRFMQNNLVPENQIALSP